MKLKTLKDINMMYEGTPQGEAQLKEDLKQEAIKNMKSIVNAPKLNDYTKAQMLHWIKHFFNITESDLKQSKGGKE